MANKQAGKIYHDCLWIQCGAYEHEEPTGLHDHQSVAAEYRQHGWSKTVKSGWVCPRCLVVIKIEREEARLAP